MPDEDQDTADDQDRLVEDDARDHVTTARMSHGADLRTSVQPVDRSFE
jgi:hypothetical protein